MLCTATPDISSLSEHINNTARVSRLSLESVSNRSGKSRKSGKVRESVRGSRKVKEIRDFLEKVKEKSGKKIFVYTIFYIFVTLCGV